jgi:hypothetical protein
LLITFLTAVVSMLRAVGGNTRREFLGLGAIVLIGLFNDVTSLLPHDPPAGLTTAQVQMLDETHRGTMELRQQFDAYSESEGRLDEAWVSNLPRAELRRNAMLRGNPARDGKVLAKMEAEAPSAAVGAADAWTEVVVRDPLTDQLAQG